MIKSFKSLLTVCGLLVVVTFLAPLSSHAGAADCADSLAGLSFQRIDAVLFRGKKEIRPGSLGMSMQVSKDQVTLFWESGFPYLRAVAAAHDASVAELLSEYMTMRELIAEGLSPEVVSGLKDYLAAFDAKL